MAGLASPARSLQLLESPRSSRSTPRFRFVQETEPTLRSERHEASRARTRPLVLNVILHVVFVLSGAAALFYQLIWQRTLLIIYGSNSESVSLVVTAFMVGLGLGSLAGGKLSVIARLSPVLCFSAAELLIGVYGFFSLGLFHWVGNLTLGVNLLGTGVLAFLLVFIPTSLMGATLPLLVAFRINSTGDTGRSVSLLYFANTLGAGVGALVAAFILLPNLGLAGSVRMAALVNVASALLIFLGVRLTALRA